MMLNSLTDVIDAEVSLDDIEIIICLKQRLTGTA